MFFIFLGRFLWFFQGSRLVFRCLRLFFHGSRLVFHSARTFFFMVFQGSRLVFLVPECFLWFFKVPGWFLMVPGGFSWFQVSFS